MLNLFTSVQKKHVVSTNNIAIGLVRVRKIRFQPTKIRFFTARNVLCYPNLIVVAATAVNRAPPLRHPSLLC
jgi:hypothetical protein